MQAIGPYPHTPRDYLLGSYRVCWVVRTDLRSRWTPCCLAIWVLESLLSNPKESLRSTLPNPTVHQLVYTAPSLWNHWSFKEWRPHLPNPTKRQIVRQCHPKRFTFVTFFRTPQCLVDILTSLPNPTVDTLTSHWQPPVPYPVTLPENQILIESTFNFTLNHHDSTIGLERWVHAHSSVYNNRRLNSALTCVIWSHINNLPSNRGQNGLFRLCWMFLGPAIWIHGFEIYLSLKDCSD